MSSDFFLEETDQWRDEAWEIMRQRPDVKFFLLTKRPQRVAKCLPEDQIVADVNNRVEYLSSINWQNLKDKA